MKAEKTRQISELVQETTRKIVQQTETFIQNAESSEPGEEGVAVMVDGVETKVKRDDYEQFKAQNKELLIQMKSELRQICEKDKNGFIKN